MVTVRTKDELAKAIDNGETRIRVEGKSLQAACYLAAKYQNLRCTLESLRSKPDTKLGYQLCLSGGEIVIITIAILMTALGIIGILKNRKVKINYRDGTVEIE